MLVSKIHPRQIIDSRGFPTIEVDITLSDGSHGRGMVPSGASTGKREALELRDGGKDFHGKGVTKAVENVKNIISKNLEGRDFESQEDFDNAMLELDGTENKSKLGANAILACSLAFIRAVAAKKGHSVYEEIAEQHSINISLPTPMLNVINGGAHADNSVDIQEFMLIPIGATSFLQAMKMSSEVFHTLKKQLSEKELNTAVGDEGGFAPNLGSNEEAIVCLCDAVNAAGYSTELDFKIALDVASSEFYKDGKYVLESEGKSFTSDEFVEYLAGLASKYPIVSIEDGMAEDDFDGWKKLTERLGSTIQLVGDDLLVTNPKILEEAISNKWSNSILIKLNQIGTLTETIKAIKIAQNSGFNTIISHRSGETEDSFIADLAVGINAGQIKTGSMSRSDRIAKYNQLLRLEDLNPELKYQGNKPFAKYST